MFIDAYTIGERVCFKDDYSPIIEFNPFPCGNCRQPPCSGVLGGCTPCGQRGICKSWTASPYIYQKCAQSRVEYLRKFSSKIYSINYNWFYDPSIPIGQSPCQAFKWANCGIDVTVLRLDSNIPVCTTTRDIEDYRLFQELARCPETLQSNYYLETVRRVAYATVIVSGCNQMLIVILSKANDEFYPGFDCRVAWNPCYPCCHGSSTVKAQ